MEILVEKFDWKAFWQRVFFTAWNTDLNIQNISDIIHNKNFWEGLGHNLEETEK